MTTHVFLLIGQSNMVGLATDDGGDQYPANVTQWDRTATIIAAEPILDHWNETAGTMGLGRQFAIDYTTDNPTIDVLLVPAANTSTGFSNNDWNKGDVEYQYAVDAVNAAIIANPTFIFTGILWHQGENDNGTPSTYEASLHAMIADMRADISAADNTTPFIVGELLVGGSQTNAVVQQALTDTPDNLPYTGVASSTGLTDRGDNLHFSASGLRTLGSRYNTALTSALLNTGDTMAIDNDRTRKQKITIQNGKVGGSGTLTDFPVLITLDHLDDEVVDAGLSSAQADGGDLQFSSDASGVTRLALEVAQFTAHVTPGSRLCELYVKVPTVSATVDTEIWVWYNTPTASVQPAVAASYGRNAVWTSFARSYHLNEAANTTAGGYADSAGNQAGTGETTVTDRGGQFGQALETPGGDTSAGSIETGFKINTNNSMGGWFYYDSPTSGTFQLTGSHDLANHRFYFGPRTSGEWLLGLGTGSTGTTGGNGPVAGTWYRAWLVADGGTARFYVNGASKMTFGYTFSAQSSTSVTIGAQNNVGANFYQIDGAVDNFVLSSDVKSVDWILTDFNNQDDPATFATAGTPESASGVNIFQNDKTYKYLGSLGFTGSYNDRLHAFLSDNLGREGALSELTYAYVKANGRFI